MSKTHVYIRTFDANGALDPDDETGWQEVTNDVLQGGVGTIKRRLDNTDFDIGILRSSELNLSLRNDHGKYSSVGGIYSMFVSRRMDSRVRVTWEPGEDALYCNFFELGEDPILSEEVTLFEGLIDDRGGSKTDADSQVISFNVMGYEAVLSRAIVPFSSITNGDTMKTVLYTMLNQPEITAFLTVDLANINPTNNLAIDDKDAARLENSTVFEGVGTLLEECSSILYVRDGVIYVAPRTESADLQYTFHGEGSIGSIENLFKITSFKEGIHRVFNYVNYSDSSVFSEDDDSIETYGKIKKEIGSGLYTDPVKQAVLVESVITEFSLPKEEFELECPMTPQTAILFLLDKIAVDYPFVIFPLEGEDFAVYGAAEVGVDKYAGELNTFSIDANDRFKIIDIGLMPEKDQVRMTLRKV